MAKNNTITNAITLPTTKAASDSNKDFLMEIREITKAMNQNDAFYKTVDFLSKEEGALSWLLIIKEKCGDHLVVSKKFNFNASDMIGSVIKRRLTALEKAAFDVNLEDVLQELESVAWCCGLS